MTLKDFQGILDYGCHLREHITHHAHTDQRQHGKTHLGGTNFGVVAHDDACVFELAHALDDGRGRQADPTGKLGEAEAAMLLQMVEQLAIDAVEDELFL